MSLTVLLDLSRLERPDASPGVRRYAEQLGEVLAMRERQGIVRALALQRTGLLGRRKVSEDLLQTLRDVEDQRRRGLLARLPRLHARPLERAARAHNAQLIHCLTPEGSPRGPLALPRLVTCHHVDSDRSAAEWHGAKSAVDIDQRHFQRADRVIATSRATAQELIARLNVPRAKIEVVYNGVDTKQWRPDRTREDSARLAALGAVPERYFLCVGTANRRKNADGMLRALARARGLLPSRDLRFIWVGQQDRYEEEDALALARRLGLGQSVRFVGRVPDGDLAALYRGATALCFVSRREGFGYPVLEAMACGCPVITSTCSSLGEIAGDAALTVDPEDPAAIADALLLLVESPEARRALAAKGTLRVSDFSLERFASATLDAYRHTAPSAGR